MNQRLQESLKSIFKPQTVAIVGASNNPKRWGYHTLRNMIEAEFHHGLFPVNPNEKEVQGIPCYPSIARIPAEVDLAVIVVNTTQVAEVIAQCIEKKIRGGIVITAGFAEIGQKGARLQEKVARDAQKAGFYFLGPNCWGIWSSEGNVNTLFNKSMQPPKGSVAFVSQSGTLGEYFFNGTQKYGFGVSKFVGCGNQACIALTDVLAYLGDEPETRVITAYIEDVGDGRRFFEVARQITLKKPLLVFKAGSTPEAARAAKSHTAAMAGNDAVFEAVCRQAGILRCSDFMDMFAIAGALCYQPIPRGNRVAVISPGGGFCVTAAEACSRLGLALPQMTAEAQDKLRAEMNPFAPPPVNPIDAIGRKGSSAYLNIIEIVAAQEYIDGIIITPRLNQLDRSRSPQAMIRNIELAEATAAVSEKYNKPLICASEHELQGPIFEIYKRRHIPFLDNPFDCAKVMAGMVQYGAYRNKKHCEGTEVNLL
jgi:acetyltransferase